MMTTATATATPEHLLVSTVLHSWRIVTDRIDKTIASLTDEQLQLQVTPGKNRIFYLLGHLTAVHDRLLPLLRLGERLHPELDEAFLNNPDRSLPDAISPADLRAAWTEVNRTLAAGFDTLTPVEWLERHNSVSEEDFAKDPLRNRLAIVINRNNHDSFHAGQIALTR